MKKVFVALSRPLETILTAAKAAGVLQEGDALYILSFRNDTLIQALEPAKRAWQTGKLLFVDETGDLERSIAVNEEDVCILNGVDPLLLWGLATLSLGGNQCAAVYLHHGIVIKPPAIDCDRAPIRISQES